MAGKDVLKTELVCPHCGKTGGYFDIATRKLVECIFCKKIIQEAKMKEETDGEETVVAEPEQPKPRKVVKPAREAEIVEDDDDEGDSDDGEGNVWDDLGKEVFGDE